MNKIIVRHDRNQVHVIPTAYGVTRDCPSSQVHHLKRFGLEDKQWEALVNRYGLTNAKYMVETVFGVKPLCN